MDKKNLSEIARKKVKDKKEFYRHFNAFCIVTFSLFLINCLTTPGTWWFILPIIGWAMAVLGHYLNVFGFPSFRDETWEQKQFEKEMDKLEMTQHLDDHEEDTLDISDDELELRALKKRVKKYDMDDFV